nr:MAG TPA: hypothetical protein [Caudoviricetes sp.]
MNSSAVISVSSNPRYRSMPPALISLMHLSSSLPPLWMSKAAARSTYSARSFTPDALSFAFLGKISSPFRDYSINHFC